MEGVSAFAPAPAMADLYGINSAADVAHSPAAAAKQLESLFLSMVLKEMRQTLDPDGGLFPGDTSDVQGGLFDFFLGNHLADAGGVGLAASIQSQLERTSTSHGKNAPAGSR